MEVRVVEVFYESLLGNFHSASESSEEGDIRVIEVRVMEILLYFLSYINQSEWVGGPINFRMYFFTSTRCNIFKFSGGRKKK